MRNVNTSYVEYTAGFPVFVIPVGLVKGLLYFVNSGHSCDVDKLELTIGSTVSCSSQANEDTN